MKIVIVKNGNTQIAFQPENEFEALVLKEMNGATLEMAPDKMVIIDKTINNGAILRKTQQAPEVNNDNNLKGMA